MFEYNYKYFISIFLFYYFITFYLFFMNFLFIIFICHVFHYNYFLLFFITSNKLSKWSYLRFKFFFLVFLKT